MDSSHVIQLKDGSMITVSGMADILELIEDRLGTELRWIIEDELAEYEEDLVFEKFLETELDNEKQRNKAKMREIRKQSELIAELIAEDKINKSKLSTAAGAIGMLTWEEVNR